MKEVSYKELKFNPFNLLGKEWMLISAGSEQTGCNTMTISWGHLGCPQEPTEIGALRARRGGAPLLFFKAKVKSPRPL